MRLSGVLTVILALINMPAGAALIDRGGGFIYDDVLDITWTQNANITGNATWEDHVSWADSLSLYDSVRDVTWDDWRLASMDVNDDGTVVRCSMVSEVECRDNEFGYLHHQYGISTLNQGPFTNLGYDIYWSGTQNAQLAGYKWHFNFYAGNLGSHNGTDPSGFAYAWAVRDGDVGASVVPVPAAVWLFGSALAGLGWLRRSRAY